MIYRKKKCRHNTCKIPNEARVCAYCDQVEDEKHFLISCNLFETERRELLENLNILNMHNMPNDDDVFYI